MKIIQIKHREDERVVPYLSLRKSSLLKHYGEGYFLAETHKVVRLLLQSDLSVESILSTSNWIEKLQEEGLLKSKKVFSAPKELMESIVGFNLHQGIMAIAKRPPDSKLENLGKRIIVLNKIHNPENTGSIVRTGIGLQFPSFVVDTSDPYLRRAVRVSMGNIFTAKIHRSSSLVKSLNQLKERGFCILGSQIAKEKSTLLHKYRFKEENYGLPLFVRTVNFLLKPPQKGGISSHEE